MQRKYYIDNLRILLTCLVVLHHLAITYGGPGLWYYNEVNTDPIISILLSMFVATNQAFFMGMFFMISAFFLEKTWIKKPVKTIIIDRIKRLGIPIIFYAFIISPIIIYVRNRFSRGETPSFVEFFETANWFTFGPLWFVEALLIFTIIAALFQGGKWLKQYSESRSLPKNKFILIGILIIGLLSFIIRVWMPVGWTLKPFGFQIAHFPQYISLYAIGFIASKNNWFAQISYKNAKKWLLVVVVLVVICFPLGFYLGGAIELGAEIFMGGFTWQSLFYCIWEQTVGIGIMIGLIGVFKEKFNTQNKQLKTMSASAYTVYIIHALVLVLCSMVIKDLEISATLKFILLSPVVLIICFVLAHFIRKLPLARNIL